MSALEDRGITGSATFVPTDTVQVKNMQLARADVYVLLLTAPNSISEGGTYSISAPEREALKEMAESIYAKYGEELSAPLKRPAVRAKTPW